MKSVLIIGMSTFGQHLLKELSEKNVEIMIVDCNENMVTPNMQYATDAKIADCTVPGVLDSFGVDEFDSCFVCLGGNFTNALEISYRLKELGAKRVVSEVNRAIEKKFLLKNGADSVIYPEEDMAVRVSNTELSDNIFDAFRLSDGFMIYEISVPSSWIGKSLSTLRLREKYDINIVAKKINGHIIPVIKPDSVFEKDEHVLIVCHEKNIKKLI